MLSEAGQEVGIRIFNSYLRTKALESCGPGQTRGLEDCTSANQANVLVYHGLASQIHHLQFYSLPAELPVQTSAAAFADVARITPYTEVGTYQHTSGVMWILYSVTDL